MAPDPFSSSQILGPYLTWYSILHRTQTRRIRFTFLCATRLGIQFIHIQFLVSIATANSHDNRTTDIPSDSTAYQQLHSILSSITGTLPLEFYSFNIYLFHSLSNSHAFHVSQRIHNPGNTRSLNRHTFSPAVVPWLLDISPFWWQNTRRKF